MSGRGPKRLNRFIAGHFSSPRSISQSPITTEIKGFEDNGGTVEKLDVGAISAYRGSVAFNNKRQIKPKG
jgi:hypothetical protein